MFGDVGVEIGFDGRKDRRGEEAFDSASVERKYLESLRHSLTSLASMSRLFTRIWAAMSLCSVVLKSSCSERFFDS